MYRPNPHSLIQDAAYTMNPTSQSIAARLSLLAVILHPYNRGGRLGRGRDKEKGAGRRQKRGAQKKRQRSDGEKTKPSKSVTFWRASYHHGLSFSVNGGAGRLPRTNSSKPSLSRNRREADLQESPAMTKACNDPPTRRLKSIPVLQTHALNRLCENRLQ